MEKSIVKLDAEAKRIKKEADRKKIEANNIAKLEAKRKIESDKREKLELELKTRAENDRKAQEKEEARIQDELNKGDSAKVKDLIADLTLLKSKYNFKSKKNKRLYNGVAQLIDKIIRYIKK